VPIASFIMRAMMYCRLRFEGIIQSMPHASSAVHWIICAEGRRSTYDIFRALDVGTCVAIMVGGN
jgi:hypothetical protein